jgi:hypothetical protein
VAKLEARSCVSSDLFVPNDSCAETDFQFSQFPLSFVYGLWICSEQCMHVPKQLGSIVVCRYTLALQVRTIGRRCHHGSDKKSFPIGLPLSRGVLLNCLKVCAESAVGL